MRTLRVACALALGLAAGSAEAQGSRRFGGGGGYGGTGFQERAEINPAASRRLAERMRSLGYDGWLTLVSVEKPGNSEGRFAAEIRLEYRANGANHLPTEGNVDAYFAKIVLAASDAFAIPVDGIKLTVKDMGCGGRRFFDGQWMAMGGCSGRFIGGGATVSGMANDIRGTMPKDVGMWEFGDRMVTYLKGLGGKTTVRVTEGTILVRATGLKGAVAKDLGRSESVTLFLSRKAGGMSGTISSSGESTMKVDYMPGFYIVADGSYDPAPGGDGKPAKPVPFEPDRYGDLDAFAKAVRAKAETPSERL